MSANHTPTPWKPSTCGLGVWSASEPIGANKIIATCDAVARSKAENAANTSHIVRCVNMHDQLCDALDYLLEQTVDMDLKHGITLSEGEEDARAKALAAIAKARGA